MSPYPNWYKFIVLNNVGDPLHLCIIYSSIKNNNNNNNNNKNEPKQKTKNKKQTQKKQTNKQKQKHYFACAELHIFLSRVPFTNYL